MNSYTINDCFHEGIMKIYHKTFMYIYWQKTNYIRPCKVFITFCLCLSQVKTRLINGVINDYIFKKLLALCKFKEIHFLELKGYHPIVI